MSSHKSFIHEGFENEPLNKEKYSEQFGLNAKQIVDPLKLNENALNRAWLNRDFEIDLYWKRTNYFWAFIAIAFGGYSVILNSGSIKSNFPEMEFVIICIGFFLSLVWLFANKGSKYWQESWEYHIDMLEDNITGPIYKTTKTGSKYSVSKLNMILSEFVMVIWVGLEVRYFIHNKLYKCSGTIDYALWSIFIITLYFSYKVYVYGKTRKGDKEKTGFTIRKRID